MILPCRATRKVTLVLALICFLLCGRIDMRAQTNEERNMASIIYGLQTGSMNWNRFAPEIKQIIAYQTGGTGMYLGLAALGPPLRVKMLNVFPLPAGAYYVFESRFAAGTLQWQVVADLQGNIWGLQFQPVAAATDSTPTTTPDTDDTDQPKQQPKRKKLPVGGADHGDAPTTKDEACKLYPNLC